MSVCALRETAMCVQNFRFEPFTVFEIQGFKLTNNNNNNKQKNWENEPSMLVMQFLPSLF